MSKVKALPEIAFVRTRGMAPKSLRTSPIYYLVYLASFVVLFVALLARVPSSDMEYYLYVLEAVWSCDVFSCISAIGINNDRISDPAFIFLLWAMLGSKSILFILLITIAYHLTGEALVRSMGVERDWRGAAVFLSSIYAVLPVSISSHLLRQTIAIALLHVAFRWRKDRILLPVLCVVPLIHLKVSLLMIPIFVFEWAKSVKGRGLIGGLNIGVLLYLGQDVADTYNAELANPSIALAVVIGILIAAWYMQRLRAVPFDIWSIAFAALLLGTLTFTAPDMQLTLRFSTAIMMYLIPAVTAVGVAWSSLFGPQSWIITMTTVGVFRDLYSPFEFSLDQVSF
jgi:hypothetical protein